MVWLTEDTEEAREEVFKKNPSLTRERTQFKKADYSLAYLNQVLEKVSTAMVDGKLTTAVTAYVDEYTNRVVVSMTEEKAEEVDLVTSMDPMGGAVVFEFGADQLATFG